MFLGLIIKIYPNNNQKKIIDKNLEGSRYVYNYFLKYSRDKKIYTVDSWKKELFNLVSNNNKDISGCNYLSLIKTLDTLEVAYKNYFESHTNPPKYKKENDTISFKIQNSKKEIMVLPNKIYVPILGGLKCRYTKNLIGKRILSITIKRKVNNYYEASILYEDMICFLPKTYRKVGIDLGARKIITTSDGEKFSIVDELEKKDDRIVLECKKLSSKIKGSKNWLKQREIVKKSYIHRANYVKDMINKITTYLVKKYDVIFMEDLSIKKILKDQECRPIRRKIIENSLNLVTETLDYKCKMYGKKLIKIDRFFPSTQICSQCGFRHDPFDSEVFECPVCKSILDRDVNAAINIYNYGLRKNRI